MTAADISMTGVPDWVVAREDGSVEFWAVSDGFGRADSEPVIMCAASHATQNFEDFFLVFEDVGTGEKRVFGVLCSTFYH